MYSLSYIKENADSINWLEVSMYSTLELIDHLVKDFPDDLNWNVISRRMLTEKFIRKHSDRLNFHSISTSNLILKYSDQFYKDFANKISWSQIWMIHKVSESFMRKNIDYIRWDLVSQYQNLSLDFKTDFADKIIWGLVNLIQPDNG